MEVKAKSNASELINAMNQNSRYMRYMFKEQLDRRFVVGLTLCRNDLMVFLCDRSGFLGTKTVINIHKV